MDFSKIGLSLINRMLLFCILLLVLISVFRMSDGTLDTEDEDVKLPALFLS